MPNEKNSNFKIKKLNLLENLVLKTDCFTEK